MYRKCLFLGFYAWMILLNACQPSKIENEYGLEIQLSDDSSKLSLNNLPDEEERKRFTSSKVSFDILNGDV